MLLAHTSRLRRLRRLPTATVAVMALVMGSLVAGVLPAQAVSSGLVISRVYGAGGNSGATLNADYIEIFNRGSAAVSLDGLSLQYASATGTGAFGANTTAKTELPAVTVPPGGYFLVQEASGANGSALPTPDHTDATPIGMAAAAGKVVLVTGTDSLGCNGSSTPCDSAATARIIDLVGFGTTTFSETAPTGAPSIVKDVARKSAGCQDTDNNSADFDVVDPAPRNGATATAPCGGGTPTDTAPAVASTAPANGANDVPLDSNVTVTFTEDVDVAAGWYGLTCDNSGTHSAAVSGGPKAYVLNPDSDFAFGDTCSISVEADAVSDRDGIDPEHPVADFTAQFTTLAANPCDSPFTSIHDIQGAGTTSSAAGQTRTTEGVVTGDFQGGSGMNGVFIQEPNADSNTLTSEGVFVFIPAASPFFSLALNAGDTVHLRGRVTEFQNQTEIDNLDQLVVCSSGTDIAATDVTLPETINGDLERYEGMKIAIANPKLTVEQNFFQGRYGQLTLGSGGRLYQPTNKYPAGSPQALDLAAANSRALIVLDDAVSAQNRDPVSFMGPDNIRRAGDTVSGIAGILDEGPINSDTSIRDYRVQVTQEPTFSQDNARTAAPEEVGGNLKVASFNVLNYFTTLTSEDPDARGADTAQERERQGIKIWSAMKAIDADVFGLMEIENRPNANAAAAFVEGLNQYIVDHGGAANSYTAVPNPVTGTGTDFIKVAMIYKSSKVTPVGPSLSDPDGINDRPTLGQTFELNANNEKFSVVVNHFKSKGSCPSGPGPDADNGDGQGCWNAKRVKQAQRLLTFIDTVTTAADDDDALVIGDLNSYGKEDPILALEAAGLVNQLSRYVGEDAYSYVFDGLSGYLDHGLATPSASSQVVGATEWHINADESSIIDYNTNFKSPGQVDSLYTPDPYRSSDHDPVVLGLDLGGCSFTDDAATKVRTLDGDCTTGTTVGVPDGWTLDGAGHSITAYDPDGDHFRGAVVANDGAVANVRNLTVTTLNLADVCDADADRLRGILLEGAAGSITGNTVVGIKQGIASGCQEGNGIEVRNAPFGSGPNDLAVTISGNTVRDYQKTGIVANGSVQAQITGNIVTGAGPVGYIAQNGVQIGFGGGGDVTGNRISDNFYTGPDDACGVLFYDADKAKEKTNVFSGNEVNVCKVKPKEPKSAKEPKPAKL